MLLIYLCVCVCVCVCSEDFDNVNKHKSTDTMLHAHYIGVPAGTGKTWKNEKAYSSQGLLNGLEMSWKITQNTGKSRGISDELYLLFL